MVPRRVRHQRKEFYLALVFYVITGTAYASDGNEFLLQCKALIKVAEGGASISQKEHDGALVCASYLDGFLGSHAIEDVRNSKPLYCIPAEGLKIGQVARIVIKYLEDNPAKLHEDARLAVGISLMGSFPCTK